jgi:hypothetical protein
LPPVSTTLAKLVANFAAGVVDTGCKFAAGVVDTGENFATGVFDTGGKFATSINNTRKTRDNAGVVDTGGKFATGVLIPVVHLHLQISPQIFEKI